MTGSESRDFALICLGFVVLWFTLFLGGVITSYLVMVWGWTLDDACGIAVLLLSLAACYHFLDWACTAPGLPPPDDDDTGYGW